MEALQNTSTTINPVDQLGRQVGKFIKYWGFKEIHGRIWTLLFVNQEPLAPEDIERSLKISRASISLAVNELLEHEVLIKVGRSDKNAQLFDCNPHVMDVIVNVLRNRERVLLKNIKNSMVESKSTLLGENGVSEERVNNLESLIQTAVESLDYLTALKNIPIEDFTQFEYLPRSPLNQQLEPLTPATDNKPS